MIIVHTNLKCVGIAFFSHFCIKGTSGYPNMMFLKLKSLTMFLGHYGSRCFLIPLSRLEIVS